jgi:hypothetical protein
MNASFEPGPSDEVVPVPWTALDDHLHYTCAVVGDLRRDGLATRRPVPTMMRLGHGELPVAEGPSGVAYFQAAGDGSYTQSSAFAFGSTGFVVGMLAVNAISNHAARKRAEADLQLRWMAGTPGSVMVSSTRVHFWSAQESFSLWWSGLDMIDLDGPDAVVFRYEATDGSERIVRFQTYWSALIFALAAYDSFPAHPRWVSGDWLPRGFEEHCQAHGKERFAVR